MLQFASQKMHFEFLMFPWGAKCINIDTYFSTSNMQFYGTPSKLLVTPNQHDHGVQGLKAKICSAIPGSCDFTHCVSFKSSFLKELSLFYTSAQT